MINTSAERLLSAIVDALTGAAQQVCNQNAVNHQVRNHAASNKEAPDTCWLVTVTKTYGSSPRPAGSMMLWSQLTGVVGSVSGGCIEEDILNKIQTGTLAGNKITTLIYGGSAANTANIENTARFNLPCGGELHVVVESLSYMPTDIEKWQALLALLKKRQGAVRHLCLVTGAWCMQASQAAALALTEQSLCVYIGPVRKLLIIGANPTALFLAQFASALDFAVTVCDPSDDVSSDWPKVTYCQYIKAYPDGFVARDFGDCASAVVAVSHDPRIDDMALLEALPSNAFYVGAMGAKRTSQTRRDRLALLGLQPRHLKKLHAPIGLDIGSKTPSEIAMSIAAHLISEYHLNSNVMRAELIATPHAMPLADAQL